MPSTISDNSIVSFTVEMTGTEAYAFAQFLKRVGHRTYREHAVSDEDAYNMMAADRKIANALRDQVGYAPR